MTVRVEGVDQAVVKLGKLARTCKNPTRPMTQAVAHLQDKLADYPPPRRQSQPFKTAKQRAFVMAAIRDGRISIPYRRTGTLGRKWTHRVERGGLRGVVGNNTPYAPLVQGSGSQAGYHAGNWQTEKQVAEAEADTVRGFFEAEIRRQAG